MNDEFIHSSKSTLCSKLQHRITPPHKTALILPWICTLQLCCELPHGDLSLHAGKLGQTTYLGQTAAHRGRGKQLQLERGGWMSLDVSAPTQSPQPTPSSLPRHFSSQELQQELLYVPLRINITQNNWRGWDAGDLLLMCQQGNICHMHVCCCCCAIREWCSFKGPPLLADELEK